MSRRGYTGGTPASQVRPPSTTANAAAREPRKGHRHPANVARHDRQSIGDRIADRVANRMGSWAFIIGQATFTGAWIVINSLHGWSHWDEYPYVLLNLVYSFQAGFTGPILLLAQNRQTEHDRARAECDYEVNEKDAEVNRKALAQIKQNTALTQATAARIEKIVAHLGIEETS